VRERKQEGPLRRTQFQLEKKRAIRRSKKKRGREKPMHDRLRHPLSHNPKKRKREKQIRRSRPLVKEDGLGRIERFGEKITQTRIGYWPIPFSYEQERPASGKRRRENTRRSRAQKRIGDLTQIRSKVERNSRDDSTFLGRGYATKLEKNLWSKRNSL